MSPYLPTYLPNSQPTYLLAHLPTYLPTYLPTNLPTYPPTYLLTHQPTYLPTHIPTYQPTHLLTHLTSYLPNYLHTYTPTHLWSCFTILIELSENLTSQNLMCCSLGKFWQLQFQFCRLLVSVIFHISKMAFSNVLSRVDNALCIVHAIFTI